ncbi:hypothetical protein E4U42_000852 [Claviceps africana]|uniref:Uncharacterized protein n=1 Tax=Claviceps africana TaxID=83212 RepID=A0A8K0JFT7_9HYPO|nr:hypothetical protein E4U42_000852 [Claviceps africana]
MDAEHGPGVEDHGWWPIRSKRAREMSTLVSSALRVTRAPLFYKTGMPRSRLMMLDGEDEVAARGRLHVAMFASMRCTDRALGSYGSGQRWEARWALDGFTGPRRRVILTGADEIATYSLGPDRGVGFPEDNLGAAGFALLVSPRWMLFAGLVWVGDGFLMARGDDRLLGVEQRRRGVEISKE